MSIDALFDLARLQQLADAWAWLGWGDVVEEPETLMSRQAAAHWSRWPLAFAMTQLVEVPLYLLAQRGRPWGSRLWVAFMASAITHPIVWALGLVLRPFLLYAIVAEALAVAIETLWLRRHDVPRAFWWALTANAASVAVFIGGRTLLRALGLG